MCRVQSTEEVSHQKRNSLHGRWQKNWRRSWGRSLQLLLISPSPFVTTIQRYQHIKQHTNTCCMSHVNFTSPLLYARKCPLLSCSAMQWLSYVYSLYSVPSTIPIQYQQLSYILDSTSACMTMQCCQHSTVVSCILSYSLKLNTELKLDQGWRIRKKLCVAKLW